MWSLQPPLSETTNQTSHTGCRKKKKIEKTKRALGALTHLYRDTGGWDDFFYSDGGSVRHGHLPVGGFFRSPADGELPPALPPGVTERPRWQSVQTVLAQLLVEDTRHSLPYQQKPTGGDKEQVACVNKGNWHMHTRKFHTGTCQGFVLFLSISAINVCALVWMSFRYLLTPSHKCLSTSLLLLFCCLVDY